MDKLAEILAGQGLAGAMLLMLVFAVKYLQGRRDADGEARLADSRESLKTQHETNIVLGKLTDALAGTNETLSSLTITVQTMHAESRTALEVTRERDNRVEDTIKGNGEVVRQTLDCIRQMKGMIAERQGKTDGRGR